MARYVSHVDRKRYFESADSAKKLSTIALHGSANAVSLFGEGDYDHGCLIAGMALLYKGADITVSLFCGELG